MQTIGEKLEDARKRRGIAIREASEFTKIRGEYLSDFENNSFDLNLPEIYVRGFLRTYAQYLKLNPDKIITDYNAHRLGESKIVRRESKEFLGRMDLPESGEEEEESTSTQPSPLPPPSPSPNSRRPGTDEDGEDYGTLGRNNYPKVAAGIGAGVVVALLLIVVLVAVLRTGPSDAQAADAELNGAGADGSELVTLIAEGGDILQVTVKEIESDRELYRGPLASGESRDISFNGRVRLSYSDAEYLVIEQDGNRYQLAGQGIGQSNFP